MYWICFCVNWKQSNTIILHERLCEEREKHWTHVVRGGTARDAPAEDIGVFGERAFSSYTRFKTTLFSFGSKTINRSLSEEDLHTQILDVPVWPNLINFHAVFRKNWPIILAPPLCGWRPSRKSWIHHWLVVIFPDLSVMLCTRTLQLFSFNLENLKCWIWSPIVEIKKVVLLWKQCFQ